MVKNELEFIKKHLEKISVEIWNVKCLSLILEELLENDNGNLKECEINTLCNILTRNCIALSNKMRKICLKMKI